MDPLVSIVTVAYNSEKSIAQTIESVLGQSYSKLEYLIVDGASTDGTVAVAQRYAEAFAAKGISYRIISEPDHGIYDAMNKGIRNSTGELVGLINSDDWYEPSAVERVVDTYRRTDFDLFYADLRIVKKTGDMIKHAKLDRFPSTLHWNHPTTFLRRTVYERFQYECRTIYDDWDLILRVRRAGYKTAVLNEVLANFRFGGVSNEKNLKKTWGRIRLKYGIYRKNGYSCFYFLECFAVEMAKYILS